MRYSRPVRPTGLALLCLAALSCDEQKPLELFGDDDDQALECTPGPGTFDANGRFAVLGALNVHVSASGLVESDTTSEVLLLVDITQSGTTAGIGAQLCGITIPPVELQGQEPVTFDVPTELVGSVGKVMADGSLSSTSVCANLVQSAPLVIVLGGKLSMPATDVLPAIDAGGKFPICGGMQPPPACSAATGAGCVCDQEGDGKSGGTLRVKNAPVFSDLNEVYVVLRTAILLKGQVFSSDLVAGTVEAALENSILGCQRGTNPCSSGDLSAVVAINPQITQQPDSPSTFIGKRVDAATDCAALLSMRARLFPPS